MLSIFFYELKYYFKNKKEVIVTSYIFSSFFILAIFALPVQQGVDRAYSAMLLWLAAFAAIQAATGPSWQRHIDAGEIEQFQLLPWPLEWTVLGKTLALYVATMLPMLMLLPFAALGSAQGYMAWWQTQAAGLAVGGLALVAIQQWVASLMAGYRRGNATMGLVALPFAIPVVIVGAAYARQGGGAQELLFLLGYAGLMLPITCIATAANLRASH
jgi:heme exporter protein B